jgi:hypothetical protein
MKVGAPPGSGWASWLLSRDPKLHVLYFDENFPWYFSSILFPAKTDRNKTLLKTAPDSSVFIQVW